MVQPPSPSHSPDPEEIRCLERDGFYLIESNKTDPLSQPRQTQSQITGPTLRSKATGAQEVTTRSNNSASSANVQHKSASPAEQSTVPRINVQKYESLLQSLFCPLLQAPARNLLVLVPCGHTFSGEGLQRLFQSSIKEELNSRRHDILAPYRKAGPHKVYEEEQLADFKAFAVNPFRPTYRCPLCKVLIRHPPIVSTSLNGLVKNAVELLSAMNIGVLEEIVEGVGEIKVNWKAYFWFG
ncbi:hypothetical protein NLJ89_g11793 [Agrocybe chaxingu]|uniref:Uncharacterized protein n=1 Tax=Agrocybe chaxingu TaxID=84603 RepID=A0A9W8JN33_9AGAR|nr:hypothetical protein NLJ89_g11793 [Agrocybe chaxingu]